MPDVALTVFYDDVLPACPGLGPEQAKHQIREACIEFLRETRLYKYDVPAINVVAGTRDYTLTMPSADYQVADVLDVRVSGEPITGKSDDELDALYGDTLWRLAATTGEVEHFQMADASMSALRLVLTPAASVTGGLAMRVALEPTRTATQVPAFLADKHRADIVDGALARLFAMRGRPWSDGALATYHGARFEQAKGLGDLKAARAGTRTRLRVKSHR